MKKIILFVALMATVLGVGAQTATNRTAKTKVSDALGLMPAREQVEFNRLMEDLLSTGAEGVDLLTAQFQDVNNVPVSYALSGMAAYATAPGREAARKSFAEGILRALDKSADPVVKAYYIRLLQRCGGEESVATLGGYLQDSVLGDPARGALAAIATPQALELLPTPVVVHADAPVSKILALYTQVQQKGEAAVPQLLKALKSPDRAYRNAALRFIQPYLGEPVYQALVGQLRKATPETKADILTYLGLHNAQSTLPVVKSYMAASDPQVAISAMWAATRMGSDGAGEIARVMGAPATSDTVREEAAKCLLATKGNVNALAADVLKNGTPSSQVDALMILSSRGASAYASDVLATTGSSRQEVATAAYAALPWVVTQAQLEEVFSLVEQADDIRLGLAQQAVIAAMEGMPASQQMEALKKRMTGELSAHYYVPLAATATPEALELIVKGFDGGDDFAKKEALRALCSWEGLGATDALYRIAQQGSTKYAQRALTGFIKAVAASKQTPERKQIMLTEAMDIASNSELKRSLLKEMQKTCTLQAMVLAGKYLDDSDVALRRAASGAVYHIAINRRDLYGPMTAALLKKAVEATGSADRRYLEEEAAKCIASYPKEGGFVSMFNGTDYNGWKGLVENPIKRAAMTPTELAAKQQVADETMRKDWTVKDGLLTFTGSGYDNICTAKQYGDFEMYVDWRLDAAGSEPDAGIYLRGTPQVQIWDTSRRNVGAQVGSGGLYNNKVNRSTPLTVADNTLGKWNAFYIKMVGDRVTVKLNGELVVDNVIMENYWDRSLPIPACDQIELQAHGSRVDYRNLYINELPRSEPFQLSEAEKQEGFEVLFDGTNMHEWTGNTRDYVIENGVMALTPHQGSYGGNLYTKREFGDFIYRFEFKLTPGANNGLGIRTPMEGDAAYVGMELQILDNTAPIYSTLEPYQYHGSVYGVIPAKRGALKPVGEWNYEEVIAKGNHIQVILNGEVIVDGNIAEASKNGTATMDHKSHPGLLNPKGHIGFLGHGSQVYFRNIRVKELK